MKITYHCYFGRQTGYARAAHDNILGLLSAGVEVAICPFGEGEPAEFDERYKPLFELPISPSQEGWGDCIHLVHDKPLSAIQRWFDLSDSRTCVFTTWETSDMPAGLSGIGNFDLILTPSEFCAAAISGALDFSESPIAAVPHGIDFDFWSAPNRPKRDPGQPFTFYCIGAWNARKNVEGLIKAYLSAFHRQAETQLIIHSNDPDIFEAKRLISQSGLSLGNLPALEITSDVLTDTQLRELHYRGDCFASMTRCEGWGLGAFEAMAVGNPVIMPDYGGQEEFVRKPVLYVETPCFATDRLEVHDGQIVGIRNMPLGVSCRQRWAEPSVGDMMNRMQDAYEARDRYAESQLDQSLYSIEAVGKTLADTIYNHYHEGLL